MSLDTVWNSYLADAKPATVKRGVLGGAAPAKLSEETFTQDLPNEDTTWHTVNAASAKLIKRTGQPELAKKLEQDNQEDVNKRAESKVGRPPKSKKALGTVVSPPTGGGATGSGAASSALAAAPRLPQRQEVLTSVSNGIMQDSLPIHTLEEHTRRDNQAELFALKIERPHRPTADMIINTPPASEVLKYVSTHWREEMSWYDKQIKLVANNPELTFQSVPLFIREVLQTFLRAPDPTVRWERPCFNLDREPLPHEGKIRCIAHRLSEKQTGKGYRLRELLFNDQSVKINAAAAAGGRNAAPIDPTMYLSTVPEMCFLCHIYMTTHACFNLKNRLEEKELNDLTSRPPAAAENDDLYIMNRFCVDVDKPGEYDRRKMLCTDDVSMGIWGCFPMWNERHYIACFSSSSDGGGGGVLPAFAETDELLFRLPRVPLQVTDSSKQSDSIQFTLSSVGQANLTSRQ